MEQAQPLTHADVERIIELAEEGGFSYLRLESDGVELLLVRDGQEPPGSARPQGGRDAAASPAPVAGPAAPVAPARASSPPPATAPTPMETAPGETPAGPWTDVVSPMIGIVYLAPTPTAQPYVRVGQTVQAGDTVALVEVMKMFTPVQTEVGGVVRAILVTNGEHVDRGQPLLRLGD